MDPGSSCSCFAQRCFRQQITNFTFPLWLQSWSRNWCRHTVQAPRLYSDPAQHMLWAYVEPSFFRKRFVATSWLLQHRPRAPFKSRQQITSFTYLNFALHFFRQQSNSLVELFPSQSCCPAFNSLVEIMQITLFMSNLLFAFYLVSTRSNSIEFNASSLEFNAFHRDSFSDCFDHNCCFVQNRSN